MTLRPAIADDVPEIVRVTNLAYRVEDFFVQGDRTRDAEVRERMARPGAAFLVIDVPHNCGPGSNAASDVDSGLHVGAPTYVAQRFSFAREADPERRPQLGGSVFVQITGDRGFFAMLSVEPALQKSGVGRALITGAEEHCRAAGCRFLDLDVVNLRRELPAFYARFGFAPYDTAAFRDPTKLTRPAHLILMTKPLVDIWA